MYDIGEGDVGEPQKIANQTRGLVAWLKGHQHRVMLSGG